MEKRKGIYLGDRPSNKIIYLSLLKRRFRFPGFQAKDHRLKAVGLTQ